jgi:hypothetical protein
MLAYAIRRFLGAIPTLLIIITLAFFMMRIAPGGPFDGERRLPAEIEANIEAAYDLDKPLYQQYFIYLGRLVRGDLSASGSACPRSRPPSSSERRSASLPRSGRTGRRTTRSWPLRWSASPYRPS